MIRQFIDPKLEKLLRTRILSDLDSGRKNFDRPHTEAVVHWMKTLISELSNRKELDSLVLITAAYAHDWGYYKLFEGVNSDDPAEISKMKPKHMLRGSQMISEYIKSNLDAWYSSSQVEAIAHLVLVHDNVEDLNTENEILIMEADTLGMLDTDLVKPTFTKEENDHFISNQIKKRRIPRFQHEFAIKKAMELTKNRIKFYSS